MSASATTPRWSSAELNTFLSDNGLTSPLDLPQLDEEAVAALTWPKGDLGDHLEAVRTYRRLHNLGESIELSERLQQHGIVSANQIATTPAGEFVRENATALDLTEEEAATVHRRAVRVQNRVLQMLATVNGLAQPHFRHARFGNVASEVVEHFEELPSYQEMFGSLDYCACEQCKSIFGPAAYLVDLLRIVDRYVTKPNASTLPTELTLPKRRPDLEKITLTCAMTNDLVPYLRIVNERLLETAATLLGCKPEEVLEDLATTADYPAALPINVPLERVRSLLGRLHLSLGAIFATWNVDSAITAEEQLGLSHERAKILLEPATKPEAVAKFYGTDAAGIPELAELDNFLAATGLTVEDVEALVVQGLSATEIDDDVPQELFINQGAGSQPLALKTEENGATTIENLTTGALDRLNRLRRLADSCDWQPPEVDWALRAANGGATPAIDPAALEGVAAIRAFAARFKLAPVQAAAMLGPVKTYGTDGGVDASLFDQLFNPPSLTVETGVYQPAGNPLNSGYSTKPLEWTGESSSSAALGRVLPGLRLDLDGATALAAGLFGAEKVRVLDVEALSALYRHALMARCLNLPIDQYLSFLELLGLLDTAEPGGAEPFSVGDLELILSRGDWMTAAGLKVPLLAYASEGAESAFVDPLLDPELVEAWLRDVVAAIPPDAADAESLLDARIATFLGAPVELTTPARTMAVAAVPPIEGLTWVKAFLTPSEPDKEPPYLDYAKKVLGRAAQWLVFAAAAEVPAEALACAAADPAAFGLSDDLDPIGLDALRDIADLAGFIARYEDRRGKFVEYVELSADSPIAPAALEALEAATGWDADQVETLLKEVFEETEGGLAVERLRRLAACFAQARTLGGDVEFVRGLTALAGLPADDSAYATEAERLLAKLSASLGPAAWATAGEPVQGDLAASERDSLLAAVEVLLRDTYADIETPEDVWEYLLTDVSTGPEAQLSYVKEALNAVQLYLQRCRLRIERGVEKLEIPESWWDWILDYRRWEANRRIFVYPENYLLPSVRADRTRLFRDLEDTLQQSELTPAYVEDAYSEYLQKLLALSDLAPVDCFAGTVRDESRGGPANAFYLFGRSAAEPPRFHVCRRLEGGPWGEWEEIGLTIPATTLTPAYAFDRLFLFWVQLKDLQAPSIKMANGTVTTTYSRSSRATIQYSFQDARGRWSEPQALDQDVLVDFVGSGQDAIALAAKPLFTGAYDVAGESWQRVLAFGVGAPNLAPGLAAEADAERLVVIHGGTLNPVAETVNPEEGTAPSNPDGVAFREFLQRRAVDHDRQTTGGFPGSQLAGRAYILNPWLEGDVLATRSECLFLDPYWSQAPTEQFHLDVNRVAGAVQLVPGADPLTEQHSGGTHGAATAPAEPEPIGPAYFTGPGISTEAAGEILKGLKAAGALNTEGVVQRSALPGLDLYTALEGPLGKGTLEPLQLAGILDVLLENGGAPVLFSDVDPHRGRAVPVKGLPGSFLLDNGDQSLLLTPLPESGVKPPFSPLQEGLRATPPPLNPSSFAMPSANPPVSQATSAKILAAFQAKEYVDAAGFVDVEAVREDPKDVFAELHTAGYITEAQEALVRHIALGYPVVLKNAFVGGRITPTISEQIYQTLQTYSIVDRNGRIALEYLQVPLVSAALASFLPLQPLTHEEVLTVYHRLAEAPLPLTLSYRNQDDPGSIVEKGHFEVTRLTTAAVPRLQRVLAARGIDGLLDLHTQGVPVVPVAPFERLGPNPARIDFPQALDAAQVDFEGLYGRYFWELFFHGPILLATSLAASHRYQEAIGWFQKVFDPTAQERFVTAALIAAETGSRISTTLAGEVIVQLESHDVGTPAAPILSTEGRVNPQFTATSDLSFLATKPGLDALEIAMTRNVLLNEQLATPESRFWRFRPFRNHNLETLKEMLTDTEAVRRYDDDPFDPFAIAALRIGAFEKATVMQYVDTLLQWGDKCFAEDTWESVTAASMLYLYASDLLGPRPRQDGIYPEQAPKTFAQIREHYEAEEAEIPQFLLYLESSLPAVPDHGPAPTAVQEHGFNDLGTYFGVPENPVLTSYWDRVEDRLHKIEHSLDISGRPRSLALFEPPLDPLALARAAAASNDAAPSGGVPTGALPPVRFAPALQRARSLTATVSALGAQTLAAIERGDGEELALLQATQQAQILSLTAQVQQDQIDAAAASLASLKATLAAAEERVSFYGGLLATELIEPETTNLDAMAEALRANIVAGVLNTAASIAYAVPQVGSPFAMTYGGVQLGSIVLAAGGAAQISAEVSNYVAQRSLTMAGYERREEEWNLQLTLAQREVEGAEAQIKAAEAQAALAKQELAINAREVAQNQELEKLLRSKFSNEQLYRWMTGRLSTLHYQTYLLALEAAAEAQSAFQFEFHSSDSFLETDVWDGARKGLLAGEALGLALDQMEAAAQEPLQRPLEIERVISLGQLDPLALDALKTSGSCEFELPELLFDYDYPGHYARQVKSISISIPAIVGPYENVKATLTQTFNALALEASKEVVEWLITQQGAAPAGVRVGAGGQQQIAVSRGVEDSGQFVLDFSDPRYLPFEGTGAVSRWRLEMTPEANRFDFSQLSDVIVTVRYTARSAADLAPKVRELLQHHPLEVGYYVDARQGHPIEWEAMLRNHSDPTTQTLRFEFEPQWSGALKSLTLEEAAVRLDAGLEWPTQATPIGSLTIAGGQARPLAVSGGFAALNGLGLSRADFSGVWEVAFDLDQIKSNRELQPLLKEGWLDPDVLTDLEVIDVCKAEVY